MQYQGLAVCAVKVADPEDACEPQRLSHVGAPWVALVVRSQEKLKNCTFDVKVSRRHAVAHAGLCPVEACCARCLACHPDILLHHSRFPLACSPCLLDSSTYLP